MDTTTIGENILFKPSRDWKNQAEDPKDTKTEERSLKDQLKDKKVKCKENPCVELVILFLFVCHTVLVALRHFLDANKHVTVNCQSIYQYINASMG